MRERVSQRYNVVHEKNVPMKTRDGFTLYADIVRPDAPGRYPVLVSRTPYGKDAAMQNTDNSAFFFARLGYVTVMQDCRGRFTSEGEYYPMVNDVPDGYDAVEWAARLPWSNGRVGTFGQSYLGATQYMIACNSPMPPSLGAMVPVSAAADYHEGWVYHTGGAMLWGWAVPYAIHKGRNTLERKGRQDLALLGKCGLMMTISDRVTPTLVLGEQLCIYQWRSQSLAGSLWDYPLSPSSSGGWR